MSNKQLFLANILSTLLVIIITIVLITCSWFFIKGQLDANRAIADAGKAIIFATTSDDNPAQAAVDYASAITYLEAAQQTYSENSILKITSLIYALSSSIILGYGAKMLRLGASDKQELCNELLDKTAQQFKKSSDQILRQQNRVYTAVTTCENAAHISLLLQSHFELTNKKESNLTTATTSDATARLQTELLRSLQQFRDFLDYSKNNNEAELTTDQKEMLRHTWLQAQNAITEYVHPKEGSSKSGIEVYFGKYDQCAALNFVKEIEKLLEA